MGGLLAGPPVRFMAIIIHKAAAGVSQQALARFVRRARRSAGLAGQVNVMLASSREVRALNRRFRSKDAPTDVLAFPCRPSAWPGSSTWVRSSRSRAAEAGDIVICSDIAAANARRYGHPPALEVKILILHGMLHLAGYDHEGDAGEMARKEERLRRKLGLSDGLIGRARAIVEAATARGQRATANHRRR